MTTMQNRQALLPGVVKDRRKSLKVPQTLNARPPVAAKGITIGREWRVGADALNVILYRRVKTRSGKERWEVLGYFSTLGNALVALVRQGVRDTELASIRAVQDKIAELERDILKMAAGR